MTSRLIDLGLQVLGLGLGLSPYILHRYLNRIKPEK